jgi:hypothetical protein
MATPHARPDPAIASAAPAAPDDHGSVNELFHRLNNLLGIVLVNAELLEAKAGDETTRARAGQVVTSVIDALAATRHLRDQIAR